MSNCLSALAQRGTWSSGQTLTSTDLSTKGKVVPHASQVRADGGLHGRVRHHRGDGLRIHAWINQWRLALHVRELSLGELRRSLAMVQQEPVLWAGTIRDNIAYGRDGATDEDIERAARDGEDWTQVAERETADPANQCFTPGTPRGARRPATAPPARTSSAAARFKRPETRTPIRPRATR